MNKAAGAGVGVVVLLAAGYLGATAWSGQQIEARHREQLAHLQAQLPFVRFVDQKYDKGFFASTSTMTLRFGCASGAEKPLPALTVTSAIKHGPIAGGTFAAAVVDSQLRIAGGDADAQRLVAAFGTGAPLTARTVVAFDGRSRSTVASPAAQLPVGKGIELAWQGFSGEVEASGDGRTVSYTVKGRGLTLTDLARQTTVKLGAYAMQGDGHAITAAGPFLTGKVQGTVDAMEFAGGGAEPLKVMLESLAFASATTLDGELLGGTSTLAGKGAIGDVRLDKIDMKVSMKRLHAPTYQRLIDAVTKEAYRCDGKDKPADLAALQGRVQGDVLALLRHGPEFSLDRLAVESGGQTGEVSYAVGVDGVTEAQAAQPLPALLMAHAHARAATRLPVSWLGKLSQAGASRLQGTVPDPAMVDALLEQAQAKGFIVRDGDYVKSDVAFAKGALTVNGKPLGPR